MADILLSLRGVTKRFGTATAVDRVDFDVRAGETFTLLGPSGCGKTTTLRMIAGLEVPDEGTIRLGDRTIVSISDGIVVPPERRQMGMVFQSYAIWPHMTVGENIAYPLNIRRVPRAKVQSEVARVLDLVGMRGYEDRPAPLLSGGQQQRVALARALVYEPEVLLLDEPLSNLDVKLREMMRIELKELQQRLGLTFIYVTHDQSEALSLSDQIAVMNHGRIEDLGSPHALYRRPGTTFTRDFLGKSVTVDGRIAAVLDDAIEVILPGVGEARIRCRRDGTETWQPGQDVSVSVRPESVRLEKSGDADGANRLAGKVEAQLYLGDRSECEIRVGNERFLIYADADLSLVPGQDVRLYFPPEQLELWRR
jgi:ABC-type Fe3+/spermidine/putrescine transport system ATPase subunit